MSGCTTAATVPQTHQKLLDDGADNSHRTMNLYGQSTVHKRNYGLPLSTVDVFASDGTTLIANVGVQRGSRVCYLYDPRALHTLLAPTLNESYNFHLRSDGHLVAIKEVKVGAICRALPPHTVLPGVTVIADSQYYETLTRQDVTFDLSKTSRFHKILPKQLKARIERSGGGGDDDDDNEPISVKCNGAALKIVRQIMMSLDTVTTMAKKNVMCYVNGESRDFVFPPLHILPHRTPHYITGAGGARDLVQGWKSRVKYVIDVTAIAEHLRSNLDKGHSGLAAVDVAIQRMRAWPCIKCCGTGDDDKTPVSTRDHAHPRVTQTAADEHSEDVILGSYLRAKRQQQQGEARYRANLIHRPYEVGDGRCTVTWLTPLPRRPRLLMKRFATTTPQGHRGRRWSPSLAHHRLNYVKGYAVDGAGI